MENVAIWKVRKKAGCNTELLHLKVPTKRLFILNLGMENESFDISFSQSWPQISYDPMQDITTEFWRLYYIDICDLWPFWEAN